MPLLKLYKETYGLTDQQINDAKKIDVTTTHKASLLKNADQWVTILDNHKSSKITIYSDYDVDGILSGTLIKVALNLFGFKNVNLYPANSHFGYGLTLRAADAVLNKYPETELIITADNGIVIKETVDYLLNKDVRVLVSDHHIGDDINYPDNALSVVDPAHSSDTTYPFSAICGTTVAYKLMSLYAEKFQPERLEIIKYLEILVGIATVADVMPAIDENRYYIKNTIKMFENLSSIISDIEKKSNIDELLKVFYGLAGIKKSLKDEVSYDDLGWKIAPVLNSPRRMLGNSEFGFELFNNNSILTASLHYDKLSMINEKRKSLVNEVVKGIDHKTVVIVEESHGILGLIAGNIVKKINKPVFALTHVKENNTYIGSGRAPKKCDLFGIMSEIYNKYPEYIVQFGGHHNAAGCTINGDYINEFIEIFDELANQYEHKEDEIKAMNVLDLEIFSEMSAYRIGEELKELEKLVPYSEEIPKPLFKIDFDKLNRFTTMGKNNQHYKWSYGDNLDVIAWNAQSKQPYQKGDVVYGKLQINNYQGYKLQLIGE